MSSENIFNFTVDKEKLLVTGKLAAKAFAAEFTKL